MKEDYSTIVFGFPCGGSSFTFMLIKKYLETLTKSSFPFLEGKNSLNFKEDSNSILV